MLVYDQGDRESNVSGAVEKEEQSRSYQLDTESGKTV